MFDLKSAFKKNTNGPIVNNILNCDNIYYEHVEIKNGQKLYYS